ncbi:MAG: hypothetical protein PHD02_03565 [Bacilli bacterium]|nr:hypothetical protein [Bacilli bacterium]
MTTNEEILKLINDKLVKIQSNAWGIDKDIELKKQQQIIKIVQNFIIVVSLIFLILFLIDNFNTKLLIATIISIAIFIIVAAYLASLKAKVTQMSKSKKDLDQEALILQSVRSYLQGKIALNEDIKEELDKLNKEVLESFNS